MKMKDVQFSIFERDRYYVIEKNGKVVAIKRVTEYGETCQFGLIDDEFRQYFFDKYSRVLDEMAVAYFEEKNEITIYGDFSTYSPDMSAFSSLHPILHLEDGIMKKYYHLIDLPEKMVSVIKKGMPFAEYVSKYWNSLTCEIRENMNRRYTSVSDYRIIQAYERYMREHREDYKITSVEFKLPAENKRAV